ncbi:MAG: DUF6515 family protein [Ferruginibacter sp.]
MIHIPIRVNVLPFGYSNIYVDRQSYYYNEGVYYRSYNNEYEIIAPPLGARVFRLPANARVQVINGRKYYELRGTFYQEDIDTRNHLSYIVTGVKEVLDMTDVDSTSIKKSIPVQSEKQNSNEIPVAGTRVNELPADCRTVIINQQKFYESPQGIYYQEMVEANTINYEIVGNALNN